MLRSPLHILISLHRFLLRSKTRHRSSHLLFRPITKTTSWSAGIISKIPNTSSPILTKYIPTLGQQHEQANQLLRILQQRSTSTTRRLFLHRRTQGNGSVCIQRRTMVSSGSSSNGGSQFTTILNATHFFTPRPPILGVHGTPLLPPPPPASFRPYSTKSPWNLRQQQHFITPSSSANDTMDNANNDDDSNNHFDINTRFHRVHHQALLTHPSTSTTTSVAGDTDDGDNRGRLGKRQTSYQPPNIRGMADLMENNDNDLLGSNTRNQNDTNINIMQSRSDHGNKVYRPGLVHRGQPPRRTSPQQNQQQQKTQPSGISTTTPKGISVSPADVLRYDDLSLQTTKKRMPPIASHSGTNVINHQSSQQQWYLSIPMDLTSSSHDNNNKTSSSALESLIFTENAVSILDPGWLTSFDSWGKLIREHLSKVMVLIQLMGMEAQRYSTKRPAAIDGLPTMDFKMMMTKSDACTELHIYLPHELFAPLPTTRSHIQHWVDQLMKDPPSFDIKCHHANNMDDLTTTTTMDDTSTRSLEPTTSTCQQSHGGNRMTKSLMDDEEDDEDLVMVPSRMTERDQGSANNDDDDDSSWHIGPHYFQDIHTFLNHVDSMIESSPAFTSSGSHRKSL